uniref:Putative endonuclease/exonuclease/phosphatase family domain protein n=1 Tax=Ixodes ricinus TaxID=34613 RepID=A0A0K8RKB8_IXORI
MGQAHTVANGGSRRRRLSSLCHPFGAHSRNLSATFHATDSEVHWEQLNVNVATEEELMTLPRVTRHLARNIVDYRQAIGGFKKVEDLALVSGVGASLLQMLRPEITVRRNPRPRPDLR